MILAELTSTDVRTPGDHAITAFNPEPGGGSSSPLIHSIAAPGTPRLVAAHELFRDGHGQIGDVLTFRNEGTGALAGLEIRSIKLHVGAGGYSVNLPLPATIDYLPAGLSHSLIGYFPEVGRSGQTAEVRIRGLLNGRAVQIDLPVTIP
jgi:hypothetical protein